MSRYITLKKSDSDFQKFLLGTFSENQIALPVKSLNVGTASEEVTFEIVDRKDINMPSTLSFFLQVFKVHNFIFVMVPLFLVLIKNLADHRHHSAMAAFLAAAGVLCGFVAAGFRNDYLDHLKGFDRLQKQAGSRAIQEGWVTAAELRRYSYMFLGLALLAAIPLVMRQPLLIAIIGGALLVALWAQFGRSTSFKYQIGGELSIFVLLGPLLTLGYQVAIGSGYDLEVALLGGLWGWLLLFLIHLKNFTQILPLAQGGFHNTITWLGFDRARGFIAFWWLGFIILYFIYHLRYAGLYWGWYLSLTLLFFSIRFLVRIKSLRSPLGSDMLAVQVIGRRLFLLAVGLWTCENLWYFWQWVD